MAVLPVVITIICLIIMAKRTNYLYKYIMDKISTYPKEPNKNSINTIIIYHHQEYSQIMVPLIFRKVNKILMINKRELKEIIIIYYEK